MTRRALMGVVMLVLLLPSLSAEETWNIHAHASISNHNEAALEEATALAEEPDEVPHGFVVSIRKDDLHRKLHFLGSCFRKPGVHYRHFRILGDIMPSELDVDSKCAQCFPGERVPSDPDELPKSRFVDSEEETFSTSSSASAAPEAPPPQRRRL